MSREQRIEPIRGDSSRDTEPASRTLDPAEAPLFHLPPSFKLDPQESGRWPDGFWDHFNRAASLYKRGRYRKAKGEYLAAHSLLNTHDALNTALLRTYRKLYKAAIKDEEWDQAYRELSDLFMTLPSAITDTDRRQFNKVVEQKRLMNADFADSPVPLDKDRSKKRDKPHVETESAEGVTIALETDEMWRRPKGEKPLRLQENLATPNGFLAVSHNYNRHAGGYVSSRIWAYSSDGEIVSETELNQGFYRLKISSTGDRLIGYSDDLRLSLWNMAGVRLAERSIAAYQLLSDEDILEALEGIEGGEYYYRVVHETDIDIPGTGLSFGFTMSVSGPGDWIYASHMTPHAERIYLGCYSGKVYCTNSSGDVLSLYSTDEPVRGLMEWIGFLYIWTDGSMYVIDSERVANHIDLRNAGFECFAQWGFIVRKDKSLALYSSDGAWLGGVHLLKPPREVIPTCNGFVAFTTKERFQVSFSWLRRKDG